jgi:hypothetical protein
MSRDVDRAIRPHMTRLSPSIIALALTTIAGCTAPPPAREGSVAFVRVPSGGLQPDAVVDAHGVVHVVYFTGDSMAGNLAYVRSTDGGLTFTPPMRVNTQDGSAIAVGTIRGAQVAVATDGTVHIIWNGSAIARPQSASPGPSKPPGSPMLYSRSVAGGAFEPQRNLMTITRNLDGGGAITAGPTGSVYVFWHANALDDSGNEDTRRVWIARSEDAGATFAPERSVWSEATGACNCCGLRALMTPGGALHLLYRSATALTHRDMYALMSTDGSATFAGRRLHPWTVGACPMTSMSLAHAGDRVLGAWETDGQIYVADLNATSAAPVAAAKNPGHRKHPRLAVNARGDTLLVWTEGTAWARGGDLAWQLVGADSTLAASGRRAGIPAWSLAAAVAVNDRFVVLY